MVSSLLYTVLALQSFCIQSFHVPFRATLHSQTILHAQDDGENNDQFQDMNNISRRSMIDTGSKMLLTPFVLNVLNIRNANAAVGDLPEFSDANAVLQGLTLDVSDSTQQKDMVEFLRDGFSFKVLRQRKVGSITETWLGFGPEEMRIPENFEIPVSSFSRYGGHASICVRYDSQIADLYYKKGDDAPGDNIAFLQVGVPEYRISQMVKNGGNVLDAYGVVNVVSPSGIPMRGIIGISPDPMMFVALNCENVKQSREFYEQLGFVEQEYPFCRPNKGMGQFEAPQPKNSVYLSPSKNSMGVLLLQADKKKRKNLKPNPAFRSLNIIYTPSEGTEVNDDQPLKISDPSGTGVTFKSYAAFNNEESSTRVIEKIVEA